MKHTLFQQLDKLRRWGRACALLAIAIAPETAIAGHAGLDLPYTFEENRGQTDSQVRFLARGDGYSLFLTDGEAVVATKQRVIRMSLAGARPANRIEGLEPSAERSNYLVGNRASAWKTDVPHFGKVRYEGVYPGVDLIYHSAKKSLEYDFVVAPGASAEQIEVVFKGADDVRLNGEGELELLANGSVLQHRAPVAYQESEHELRYVAVDYEMRGDGRVGFRVRGKYDRSRPLVIDPIVTYSTLFGGDRSDSVAAVATDAEGNTYLTGETTSTNFPTVGSGITQMQFALSYSFVTKINAAGTAVLYSTYLGGSSNTRGYSIAVDAQGGAVVGGVTGARNFPLVNATQTTQPVLNIGYVAKLNAQGNGLVFSTYFGGERNDEVNAVAVDAAGNIYAAGRATSSSIVMTNAVQPAFGGNTDLMIAKYNAPGYRLAYATYYGKTGLEYAKAIAADAAGSAYVTGVALGSDFISTAGSAQARNGGSNDAFVLKLTAGGQVAWSTYFGGSREEEGNAIGLDNAGNIWIGGSTLSSNLPVSADAVQGALRGDTDAFFAKLTPDGTQFPFASYLGSTATRTSDYEQVTAMAFDADHVYLGGLALAADFPSIRALQGFGGGQDGFVAAYSHSAKALEFSTPLGGAANDRVRGLAVDGVTFLHVGGETASNNFPLKMALRSTLSGADEGFATKFCDPHLVLGTTQLQFVARAGQPAAEQNVTASTCLPVGFTVEVAGTFLSATPVVSTTNATVRVNANAANLAAGEYNGSLTFRAPDAVNNMVIVPVKLIVAPPPPEIQTRAILNAASNIGGLVSPGEIVVLYGANLGPEALKTAQLDQAGRFATTLENTRVYFDGVAAPLVYTYKGQVSVVVPMSVAGKNATQVELEYLGVKSAPVTIGVTPVTPGIFTLNGSGTGQAASLHADYSVNGADNLLQRGQTIVLYATGAGVTNPGSVDGAVTGSVLPKPVLPVTATIGGVDAEVQYAGAAPGLVTGVLQVNLKVPEGIPAGDAEVVLRIGSTPSLSGVTIAVK